MSPDHLQIASSTLTLGKPHDRRHEPSHASASRRQANDRSARRVMGPNGAPLAMSDLPPANTHWVARRKAEVVAAVRGGLLSFEEASKRYSLSLEEFLGWQRATRLYGVAGPQTGK